MENTNNIDENNTQQNTEIVQKVDKKEKYLNQINLFLESLKDIKLEESNIPSTAPNVETKQSTFNKILTKIKYEIASVYQKMNKQYLVTNKNKPIFKKREVLEASIEEGETRKVHSAVIILKQLLYRTLISQYQEGEMIWNMLCGIIRSSTGSWLQQLMNIPTTTKIEFQDQETTIRGIILRAITKKNPSFKENGFLALKKIPAIYTTSPSIVSEAVRGLCLPSTCIKPIPVNRSFGHSHTMEVELLKQMIEQDLSQSENQEENQKYEPTLVIALARADGHIDDPEKIKKVCDEFGVWLHVHGDSVGILFGNEEHKKKKIVNDIKKYTDSFSFHPERSFHGLGGETDENILATVINSSSGDSLTTSIEVTMEEVLKEQKRSSDWWDQNPVVPFSLWFLLQTFGSETLEKGVSKAVDLCHLLSENLDKMENIELDNGPNSFKVLFRFSTKIGNVEVDFLNKLNQQLLKDLERDISSRALGIRVTRVDQFQALVFDPLSCPDLNLITNEMILNFIKNLDTAIQIRISSIQFRNYFQDKADQSKSLFHVETERLFVGIGAVRYIPAYLKHQKDVAPQIENQLDVLNSALAQQLSEIDSSFSEGFTFTQTISSLFPNKEKETNSKEENRERRTCVLWINNTVVDEKTIDHWIQSIEKEGSKIEESSNLLENLSKIIEQGIKQAQKQIKEDSYANETGIIRSVPIIGSVWNWWSPAQKKETVGRSFDLAGSKLETTKVVVNTPVKTKQNPQQETQNPIESTPIPTNNENTPENIPTQTISENNNTNNVPQEHSNQTNLNDEEKNKTIETHYQQNEKIIIDEEINIEGEEEKN